MGRKPEIISGNDNDDQQQQQETTSNTLDEPKNSNENLETNHNDEDDPLIHDTILPHRKRIRKDTFQYNQPSSSSSSSQNSDVSQSFFL